MLAEYVSRKRCNNLALQRKKWWTQLAISSALIAICLFPTISNAKTLFKEDFERDLSRWVGKVGEKHNGQIVNDPLKVGNHVLSFTKLNSAGDIFSPTIESPSGKYTLSFDYLGLSKTGSITDDFGGFVGYNASWLAGTMASYYGIKNHLQDTGEWTHVTINFNSSIGVKLTLEDYIASGGITGDAYFDNIVLTDENGSDPVISQCPTDKHAIYSRLGVAGKLTVPFVDVPLLDQVTHLPTGELAVFKAELKQLGGLDLDFGLVSSKLKLIFLTPAHDPCHAIYDETQKTLHLPFVDINSQVYDAVLQHLQTIPLDLGVFHLQHYQLVQ